MYKNVMEGRGGGLGCLIVHCVGCSHLLLVLHCTCTCWDVWRGISFQGWEWVGEVDCKLLGVQVEEVHCKLLGVE